jgi:RecG-like helicase
VPGAEASDGARERLRVLAGTDDGLQLAELDLLLRGPGEILGLRQSGRLGPLARIGADAPARLADLAGRVRRAVDLSLASEEDVPCLEEAFAPSV